MNNTNDNKIEVYRDAIRQMIEWINDEEKLKRIYKLTQWIFVKEKK